MHPLRVRCRASPPWKPRSEPLDILGQRTVRIHGLDVRREEIEKRSASHGLRKRPTERGGLTESKRERGLDDVEALALAKRLEGCLGPERNDVLVMAIGR